MKEKDDYTFERVMETIDFGAVPASAEVLAKGPPHDGQLYLWKGKLWRDGKEVDDPAKKE